ncbi:hypothetical protein [Curvivirga sp.]|uniref:hypothetical protein n=1 Tax=Curvivirga sp. TaxID=2856848 RepID=UPI003B5A46FA
MMRRFFASFLIFIIALTNVGLANENLMGNESSVASSGFNAPEHMNGGINHEVSDDPLFSHSLCQPSDCPMDMLSCNNMQTCQFSPVIVPIMMSNAKDVGHRFTYSSLLPKQLSSVFSSKLFQPPKA